MKKIIKRLLILAIAFMLFSPLFGLKAEAKSIYTKSRVTDAAVEKILAKCTNESMTNEQKLEKVYIYLVKHMKYSHKKGKIRIKVSSADQKAVNAKIAELKAAKSISFSSKFKKRYKNVRTMQGTCYDMSAVFCIIANHLGYKAGLHHGRYVRGNRSTCEHWWNYVVINGQKKWFDVQAANASWKGHHSTKAIMKFYKKSKGSKDWKKHHRG
ncbi:MAG: hypothetical protein IJH71_03625 [Eubacterium sp.]|nr:hypothetical protein [Eubacterium sp.]